MKEGLENLIVTGHTKIKRSKGDNYKKVRGNYLTILSEHMAEQSQRRIVWNQNLLRATGDRKL